jgi:GntR family transcriptional regulator, rspAB operon transcriptional repressor
LKKTTNSNQIVYEFITDAISRGKLKQGASLTEEWIGSQLNMSRTPVREAIIRLQADGFITVINNRAMITPITPVDIQEIFQLRLLLEPYAAAACIGMIDREKVLEIQNFTKELYRKNKVTFSINIHDLHNLIIESTRNKRLISIVKNLQGQVTRLLNVSGRIPDRIAHSLEEHLVIIDAILAGDRPSAEQSMRNHIQSNMNDMLDAGNFHFIFKD